MVPIEGALEGLLDIWQLVAAEAYFRVYRLVYTLVLQQLVRLDVDGRQSMVSEEKDL